MKSALKTVDGCSGQSERVEIVQVLDAGEERFFRSVFWGNKNELRLL